MTRPGRPEVRPRPVTGHVVVAPDSFKGSLDATAVAGHVAAGLLRARPGLDVRLAPVADGGEGTVDVMLAHGFRPVRRTVSGPTGRPVDAVLAVRGEVAVVELAQASGLGLLPGGRPDPRGATSRGTGELVRAALDLGCRRIVLALGGSACTDGGAGLVQALGAAVVDDRGAPVAPGGAPLARAAGLDLEGWDPRLADAVVEVASDVDSPLLGPDGAAAVFGPQKGATPSDVAALEAGLRRWAAVVADRTGADLAAAPGAGAAGGTGFAALALLGARLRPGIEVVLEVADLDRQLAGAQLVVTGEGSLDEQTLRGKAPVGVARAAARHGVPAVAVCGRRTLDDDRLARAGLAGAWALTDVEPDLARCVADAGPLLERTAARLAAQWWAPAGPTP